MVKTKNKASFRKVKETQIVRDCLTYLKLKGVLAFRNNSGQIFLNQGDKVRVVRMGLKGSPDIIGVMPPDGKFLAIECKTEKGKLTEHQKLFGEEVVKKGGIYLVVRSIDDLINFFEAKK